MHEHLGEISIGPIGGERVSAVGNTMRWGFTLICKDHGLAIAVPHWKLHSNAGGEGGDYVRFMRCVRQVEGPEDGLSSLQAGFSVQQAVENGSAAAKEIHGGMRRW